MNTEAPRPSHVAWIPWVFALVTLLGVDVIARETHYARFRDQAEGVRLSIDTQGVAAVLREADPLVYGTPPPAFNAAAPDRSHTLLEQPGSRDKEPSGAPHGTVRGRAPPQGV